MKNNSYINKDAVLTNQLITHQKIKHLDHLKSQLYIQLNNPFRPLQDDQEDDGYIFRGFVIWQDDKQAEIPDINSYTKPLDEQIQEYQKMLAKNDNIVYNSFKIKSKPGQLQLRLVF